MTVTLTDLKISKYMTTRLSKSPDTTTFQVSDKEISIHPKDLRDVNSKSITAHNSQCRFDFIIEASSMLKM